ARKRLILPGIALSLAAVEGSAMWFSPGAVQRSLSKALSQGTLSGRSRRALPAHLPTARPDPHRVSPSPPVFSPLCPVARAGESRSLRMPTVGATVMLDRLGPKRSDADFIKSKLEAPGARFLVLADLKPVIRSNPQRTEAKLAWFSREELIEFGLPVGESLFL